MRWSHLGDVARVDVASEDFEEKKKRKSCRGT